MQERGRADFYKIQRDVDPAFVNFGYVAKTKLGMMEANHDITESSDFQFQTHVIMRWSVDSLMNEFHILLLFPDSSNQIFNSIFFDKRMGCTRKDMSGRVRCCQSADSEQSQKFL